MASYLRLGYLNATCSAALTKVRGRPNRVDVTYAVQEGPQAFVESVWIMGQQHTKTRFISHTANIHVATPLSKRGLLGSESPLYDLGIFDWARIQPRRAVTHQTREPVLVKVHEAKRNSLTYGVGLQIEPRTGNILARSVALTGTECFQYISGVEGLHL